MNTELKPGIFVENGTVKMVRLLNGQTDANNGASTDYSTVKMARLLNIQTDIKNGISTENKPTLNKSWITI